MLRVMSAFPLSPGFPMMKRSLLVLAVGLLAACQQSAVPASALTFEAFTLQSPGVTFPTESVVQLKSYGHYSDGTRVDLTSRTEWASSVPTVGTIGPTGIVQLSGVGASRFEGRFEGHVVAVTLFATAATLEALELSSDTAGDLARGDVRQFTAVAKYSDGSWLDVTARATWSVDGSVLGSSDQAGLVVARAQGEGVVQARFADREIAQRLQVTAPRFAAFDVVFPTTLIRPGDAQQLQARVTYSDGSAIDVTDLATWRSSDPAVIELVGANGAVLSHAAGRARITASYDGSTASVQLESFERQVTGLAFSRATLQVAQGLSERMDLFADFDDGSRAFVGDLARWSSSQPAVVEVDHDTGVVTAMGQGSATISAAFGGLIATYQFEGTAPVLQSLGASIVGGRLVLGQSADFVVRGVYSDGEVVNLSSEVTLQFGPWIVATQLSDRVRVTGADVGTALVSVDFGGQVHQLIFDVADVFIDQVEIVAVAKPIVTTGPVVGQNRFRAMATYSDGVVADVTELCNWWVDDASAANISDEPGSRGYYVRSDGGTTAVRAMLNGQIATMVWDFAVQP